MEAATQTYVAQCAQRALERSIVPGISGQTETGPDDGSQPLWKYLHQKLDDMNQMTSIVLLFITVD